MNKENLGPAERILQTLLQYTDHAVHNRPGYTVKDTSVVGVKWQPVTHKVEGDEKVVYTLSKVGKKTIRTRLGVLQPDNRITGPRGALIGEYRPAGLFPEVVTWMYRQVTEVWKLDNEFAARWASYAFKQEHRDLKVILAALMLVQSRKGDPVLDQGKVAFYDEDFRDVGEAMLLLHDKDNKAGLNPKLLLRVQEILTLPGVAAINRELGFSRSLRNPALGRWPKAVTKWLRFREENPKLLAGLVKAGFKSTVMELARKVGYKPESSKFFEALRWKQGQAKDGHRSIAIGQAVTAAESWNGLTEEQICQKIASTRPNWKRIVGLLPKEVGVTRAIVAVAIESGSFSDKDLIIATPTLEELGLLDVQDIRARWVRATKEADDMRAANIATRVKSQATKEVLQDAADTAIKKVVEQVMKGIRIYFMVDISGSMEGAIESAKGYISKFLQAFPKDKIHVSVFNTSGREVQIPHASAAGVENAFRGIRAGGGTDYGAGVRALLKFKPQADEDVIFFFVGDEDAREFSTEVKASGLNPTAFGFVKVNAPADWRTTLPGGARNVLGQQYSAVRDTATNLGVPCFMVDANTFDDPYAIPRTMRNLISATPVGVARKQPETTRVGLVDLILKTDIMQKPTWAS